MFSAAGSLSLSVEVGPQVILRVLVAAEDVVAVPVDLDVTPDRQVGGRDELVVLVHVLVFVAAQEGAPP